MKRRTRYLIVALALLALILVLGGVKLRQIQTLMAFGETMQEQGPPPEAVASAVASPMTWEMTLHAVGSVEGVQSVTVAAEVPGTVRHIRFDSGDMVERGQVLVELDADTERAQLRSARARRALARTNVQRTRGLVAQGALARQELDDAEAALATAEADVAALRAEIERKEVRAPFAGTTGIRAVSRGQYVAAGTTVTTIESVGDMYVDFSLPQEQLGDVSVGDVVRVSVPGGEPFEGTIAAIDPTVDPVTRSIHLRAHVPKNAKQLRSGMFVTVEVVLPATRQVVVVPLTAIARAPYGNSVFVIEPKPANAPGMRETPDGRTVQIARQQFVELGPEKGDFVAIAKGLEAGQIVVSEGAFKLRNNAPVVVDNRVKPRPSLTPHPENR